MLYPRLRSVSISSFFEMCLRMSRELVSSFFGVNRLLLRFSLSRAIRYVMSLFVSNSTRIVEFLTCIISTQLRLFFDLLLIVFALHCRILWLSWWFKLLPVLFLMAASYAPLPSSINAIQCSAKCTLTIVQLICLVSVLFALQDSIHLHGLPPW